MASIQYGTGAYRRDNGNLPELKLKNMFVESTTTSEGGMALLSRQGLITTSTVGDGPIKGVFYQDNVFNGDVFSVSGNILYRGTINLGTVSGTGPVSFAAGSSDELAVCLGDDIYRYDGSTLAAVSFPDDSDVRAITFHDGLYLAIKSGTHQWYWSDVLDADTWDALNFASAESKPDRLVDIKVVSDFLYLMGAETIERWANTGEADLPYSRVEGAIIQKGVIGTGVTAVFNDTLVMIGNDGVVYAMTDSLSRVSDHSIEERIASSASVSAFGFTYLGHNFYCIRIDSGSFIYDLMTSQWCEFTTSGRDNWQARCVCNTGVAPLFGDDTDGLLLSFSDFSDNGDVLERLFTAVFPVPGGVVSIDNLMIEANVGWTDLLTGLGSDPVVEMRSSVNAGATWNNWRQATLGKQGEYRRRTRWTRCGTFDFPGGMFEIRITDPVPFRVSAVTVNDNSGGRSRGV